MNRLIIFILCLGTMVSVVSCRARKADRIEKQAGMLLTAEDSLRNNILSLHSAADFNFEYLTAKAKVQSKSTNQDYNLTLNIRMHRNDRIWISINAIGSIEVARLLLTKDSVFIIDRINKQYIAKDYALLSSMLKTDIDFFSLQSLLLGNSISKYNMNSSTLSQNDVAYSFVKQKENEKVELGIRKQDSKLIYFLYELSTGLEPSKFEVNYGEFKLIDGQNFPYLIKVNAVTEKESLTINIVYVKADKVDKLDFPFNVPKRFE